MYTHEVLGVSARICIATYMWVHLPCDNKADANVTHESELSVHRIHAVEACEPEPRVETLYLASVEPPQCYELKLSPAQASRNCCRV